MATRTQRARQIASYVGAGIIPGQGGGVPDILIIDGVTYELLVGADGQPLTGFDDQYLYGVKI